ncbi:MAG TPA: hypothetical protein PKG54_14285 [Phycisphaerae bacterium]|jgi:hypothetical protein|nr:hypothetical protein [Phycisphaerae bacterium]HOB75682.1 hypothetical protein [Phycisphaerae bacterium]HOJ53294.1 hypothetical protein [Phycisphaerae bacterium]HOL27457.1 hypothetical protein [Phycisphaerae bacterium]HPP21653.1 hypothetical protein [Phycisphaerae bacterium]
MKQSRRQELKTNELSVFLQQLYASASRNANYIIGGAVVVVAVLAIALYVQHRRTQAREMAWKSFQELRAESVVEKPELLEQARAMAEQQRGKGELGYRTAELAADMAYELAMSPKMASERAKRLELLRDARQRYQGLLDLASDNPVMAEGPRYNLAKIEETLLVMGESTPDKVRSHYQELLKNPHGRFYAMADEALRTLDDRTVPLKIVATRPADTQPTTAPATAPATQPSAAVSTTPAGATAQ